MTNAQQGIWSPEVFGSVQGYTTQRCPSLQAAQSVLIYGAVLPPLTPWRGQRRDLGDGAYTSALDASKEVFASSIAVPSSPDEMRRVGSRALDEEMQQALASGRRPLVLFSGGVDSSLMAARLRALGRHDTLLVHYQFSDQDGETDTARRIARSLDLELEIVQRDDSGLNLLRGPGKVYPVPFGDISSIPTAELCSGLGRLVDSADYVIFDGSGADGAFGLARRLRRLTQLTMLPATLRSVGSMAYKKGGWRLRGKLEYAMRVSRRSTRLSQVGVLLAQNSLFDILYEAPNLEDIDAGWDSLVQTVAGYDTWTKGIVSDLAVTVAGTFAQKSLGPLRSQGFQVSYPFLSSELVRLGVRYTSAVPDAQAKAWMKSELARYTHRDHVYRPKRGFVEPRMSVFDTSDFRDWLELALRSDLAKELLQIGAVRQLLGRTDRLGSLPVGHLNLLWALMFTDRWYETV